MDRVPVVIDGYPQGGPSIVANLGVCVPKRSYTHTPKRTLIGAGLPYIAAGLALTDRLVMYERGNRLDNIVRQR